MQYKKLHYSIINHTFFKFDVVTSLLAFTRFVSMVTYNITSHLQSADSRNQSINLKLLLLRCCYVTLT